MSAVAKRYAKAIFELAVESGDFESTGQELERVAATFDDPALRRFAEDTTLDGATRKAVVSKIASALGLSQRLHNFLALLAENNRLREIGAIQRVYLRLEDRALGRIRARVQSATPLSDASRERILAIFEKQTGKRIIAEADVDPSLVGGVVVEVQGRVFDGSVRTRLARMQRALSG